MKCIYDIFFWKEVGWHLEVQKYIYNNNNQNLLFSSKWKKKDLNERNGFKWVLREEIGSSQREEKKE